MRFPRPHLLPLLLLTVVTTATGVPSVRAAPRPPWTSGRVTGSPNPPSPYTTENRFPGIRFENPVDLARVPGTDRMAVADQAGRIWTFSTSAGSENTRRDLAMDLRLHLQPLDSLLGFAFHPGFVTNRFVFINSNEPGGRPDGSRITRFVVASLNPPVIDPASAKVILAWTSGGHNGCSLAFANDGTLFISTGDGASPDPPDGTFRTGQDLGDLLAAILRIDIDRPADGRPYSIPADNPFVHTPGARPEIWAFGLRNPFRTSVDPASGLLYIGDVGWEQWEMIHLGRPGANYGWPITEGPNPRVRTDIAPGPGPIVPPIVALPHSDAASITGGRVYHGRRLERLRGAYLYGDWETGKFWALRHDGDRLVSNEELCDTTLKPVAFAEDPDGECLILDYAGGLHTFVPNTAPPANLAFPIRLSDTGLFSDLPRLSPAPGAVPYQPAASLWSDHATVERLAAVPGSAPIVTADGRETIAGRMWFFPSNAVFARTLTLELERGQPLSRRRIETQMLHFDGQAWNAYTYRWNNAQTDADLVPPEGASDAFPVTDPSAPGGRRDVSWRFLSRAECFRCHNVWAGDLLSFNWPQLGPPTGDTESARLTRLGLLAPRRIPDPARAARLVDPQDSRLPLEHRARSWLHVNCAGCHVFGAGGGVNLHLNLEKPDSELRALDERPTRGAFDIVGARILAPGDPFRSVLFHRINTEGSARMPHIGSRLVDDAGIRLVADWIRSLPLPRPSDPEPADLAPARALASEIDDGLRRLAEDPQAATVSGLLRTMNGALALLHHLDAPGTRTTPAGRRQLALAAAAAISHTNALVRDLYQRLLPPGQRRQSLGTEIRPSSILTLRGDAARGQDLFGGVAQCAQCHVRDGVGRALGPDLTAVARKYPRDQILDHILHPSRVIAPEYRSVTVTRRDETESAGFILRRTPAGIDLKDAAGQVHTIAHADIAELRESALSTMPEGLLGGLTAQEAADLLDYLASERPPAPGPGLR